MIFFDAVHAGDVHDAGDFFVGLALGRKMQKRLDLFPLIGQLDAFDGTAGVLNKLVVAGALAFLPCHALGIAILVNRPHGVGVETSGDIIVIARVGEFAGGFGLSPLFFAARGGLGKLARDIDEFFDAATDFRQIWFDAGAAITNNLPGPALVPVNSLGLNDLIQDPALFAPTFHFAFGFESHGPLRGCSKVQGSKVQGRSM